MAHLKKQPAGVTLIELTIAISIFSIVMMIALDSFLNVLKFNREAVQKQAIQDHTEFLFSLMSREIRMARINYLDSLADCTAYFNSLGSVFDSSGSNKAVLPNNTYWVANNHDELRFQNYEGLCVRYFIASDTANNGANRLRVARYNPTDYSIDDLPGGSGSAISNTYLREDWVLPGDVEVASLYIKAQNMFDKHLATDPGGLTQPPSVEYSIKLRSRIWDPSEIKIFNVIAGRNFEQF